MENNDLSFNFGLFLIIIGFIFTMLELYIVSLSFESFLTYFNIFLGIALMILGNIIIWWK